VVIDPNNQRLAGMLALADVARHLTALGATHRQAPARLAELLAALSAPRSRSPDSGLRSPRERGGLAAE
jgi:hypothetical protein